MLACEEVLPAGVPAGMNGMNNTKAALRRVAEELLTLASDGRYLAPSIYVINQRVMEKPLTSNITPFSSVLKHENVF